MSAGRIFKESYTPWPPRPQDREEPDFDVDEAEPMRDEIVTPRGPDSIYGPDDIAQHQRRDQARHRLQHREVTCPRCRHTFRPAEAREAGPVGTIFARAYRRWQPNPEDIR